MSHKLNRILVTGGAGFVGHHLCTALLEAGCDVRVLDDLSTGKSENLVPGVDFFRGDIRDGKILASAMEACDTVFHLAARVELQKSIMDPADCYSVNVAGTAKVVSQCLALPGRRLVFASSCAVYPLHPEGPLKEEMATIGMTPYALSKRAGEQTLQMFAEMKGLNACALRCFNIYGSRQSPDSPYAAVIPKFLSKACRGDPLTIYGDGSQSRDFINVRDVVAAYLLAGSSGCAGVFNIGTGKATSIIHLAEIIVRSAGGGEIEHLPAVLGDASTSCAYIASAEKKLAFRPVCKLEPALEGLIQEYHSSGTKAKLRPVY